MEKGSGCTISELSKGAQIALELIGERTAKKKKFLG
jgi:hypothetical protein